jgi:hypothetical protein
MSFKVTPLPFQVEARVCGQEIKALSEILSCRRRQQPERKLPKCNRGTRLKSAAATTVHVSSVEVLSVSGQHLPQVGGHFHEFLGRDERVESSPPRFSRCL